MTCKTCKWLDVKPDKAGRVVVRKDSVYPCVVKFPTPKLPDSITRAYI